VHEVRVLEPRAQHRADLLALPGPHHHRDVPAARDPAIRQQGTDPLDRARPDLDGQGRADHAAQ
jgi:hypothetical protein